MAKPMTTEAIKAEKKGIIEKFLTLIAKWKTILSPLSHRLDEIEDAIKYFAEVSADNQETLNTMKSLMTTCEKVDPENADSLQAAIEEIESVIYTTNRRECLDMAGALKELEPYGFNEKNAADITIYKDNKLKKVFLQVKDNVFEVDAEYNDAKKLDFKQFVFKKYVDNEIPSSATKVLNFDYDFNDDVSLADDVSRSCMVSLLEVHKVALESKYLEATADLEELKIAKEENGVKVWVNKSNDLMAEDLNSGNTYKVIKKGSEYRFTYKRAGAEANDYQELGTIDTDSGMVNIKNMSVEDRKFLSTEAAEKYFSAFGLHIKKIMANWKTVGVNALTNNGYNAFTQNKELLEKNLAKIVSDENLVSKIEVSYGGKEAVTIKLAATENTDIFMTATKDGDIDTVYVANKDSRDKHLSAVIENGKINNKVLNSLPQKEQEVITNLSNHFIRNMVKGEMEAPKTVVPKDGFSTNRSAYDQKDNKEAENDKDRPKTVERA